LIAALIRHSGSRGDAVRSVTARVERTAETLLLAYVVEGELERLRLPEAVSPRIAENLWRHTCCELFVARKGAPAYHEFNFAPSGEWAAYAFERYREGAPLADETLDPRIAVRRSAHRLELSASVALERLSLAGAALSIGLSAVIEESDGALSYWALAHPPGKPDFHHTAAFALELDEARD